jgi:hypothetical protein
MGSALMGSVMTGVLVAGTSAYGSASVFSWSALRYWRTSPDVDVTPCAQKGTKKNARGTKHYAQLKSNKKNLVGFFGTFLGAGRGVWAVHARKSRLRTRQPLASPSSLMM